MSHRRVAITGFGAVSALGVGVAPFWECLVAGRSGVRRSSLVDPDPSHLARSIAAEVPSFAPADHFSEQRLQLLDRFTQFALVAAQEAWRDAGLEPNAEERERMGVVIGTGVGGATALDGEYLKLYGQGKRVHPFTIPRSMYNAAASQLSMEFELRGPTLAISTACASGAHAIGESAEMIRSGRADAMLAGGAEASIVVGVMKAWEAMRVLAVASGDPACACRPFSRDRSGMVIGEGAGIVVLEDWDRAERRGAVVHAELAGYGATSDARHITQPGIEAPVRAIRGALAQAGLAPERIAYVNAHGTATRLNDTTETMILKEAFGSHARTLAISSTKSMHGHTLGAAGALELIATILSLKHGMVPPTAHYNEPDPDCDLDYVPNEARDMRVDAAISNSFAFGGLNAVLAVRRAV
jgi:nodulation protein E